MEHSTGDTGATYHQTAKQGYTELALCLVNKTLKMSAYGTFSPYCATPKGLANTVGAAHPRSPRGRGVEEKPPAPLPQKRWVASNL